MEITVKELIELLKKEPQDNIVDFGGLEFYRLDDKGDVTFVEFNQTITQDDNGNLILIEHE